MSAPRIVFLSPRLLRASETSATPTVRHARRAAFSTTSRRWQTEATTSRYGTANEPPAHLGGGRAIPLSAPKETKETDSKQLADPKPEQTRATQDAQKAQEAQPAQHQPIPSTEPSKDAQEATAAPSTSNQAVPQQPATDPPQDKPKLTDTPSSARANGSSALQNVLQMEAPVSTATDSAPPHLQTPRHVHHFDTYSLVRDLYTSKAFTDAQAVTIMKALRVILTENIQLARAGLMSRSDAEMDAYQFRAASSELRTETKQRRDAAADRMRAERSQVQHEVDILGQRISQESLNLKDELRGMADDRKMAVRTERRILDNRIQELGYKITVAMNSGMRNEIEGLRFLVTRNAAVTLLAFVLGCLGALSMASRKKGQDERAAKEKIERERHEQLLQQSGKFQGKDPGEREELLRQVEKGGDPSLVSLG